MNRTDRCDGLDIYGTSLSLLTDLYQLTMACGYWKAGVCEREAVFHLTYRRPPFGGGFAIAAGIAPALAFLKRFRFTDEDVAYLKTLVDMRGAQLFPDGFLAYLREMRFSCTVDCVPEGSLVFPHEPILRVKGPIIQAQLVETALLDIVNFQTLIATKAARVVQASTAESAHRAPRISAASRRRATCSRARCSAFRSRAPTRTRG
jgi:nicotinate phosphoribosyltransferase